MPVSIELQLSRLWAPGLAALILFAALSLQYAPKSELNQATMTTTIAVSTKSQSFYQTMITQSHIGTCNQCPYITQATAALSLQDYATLLLNVAVFNPTPEEVRNVTVRFDYWKPSSCSSCHPDFTYRIQFDEIQLYSTRSQRIVLKQDTFDSFTQFRYNFQIESYVAISYSISTQIATTLGETIVTEGWITVERLVPPYQLVFPNGSQSSLIIPGIFAVITFLATAILRGDISRPKIAGSLLALDPDFMKYRDRLQELLFSREIDEKEYVDRLEQSYKTKAGSHGRPSD